MRGRAAATDAAIGRPRGHHSRAPARRCLPLRADVRAREGGGAVRRAGVGTEVQADVRQQVRESSSRGIASKAEPRQPASWVLKCLQDGRAHPLAACGVALLSVFSSLTWRLRARGVRRCAPERVCAIGWSPVGRAWQQAHPARRRGRDAACGATHSSPEWRRILWRTATCSCSACCRATTSWCVKRPAGTLTGSQRCFVGGTHGSLLRVSVGNHRKDGSVVSSNWKVAS
jgi:hypothetical protein